MVLNKSMKHSAGVISAKLCMAGIPPPRLMRPPGAPPSIPPPSIAPSMIPMPASNPNVLSAPPSIMKPPLRAHGDEENKSSATIEAKPKIKSGMGDVTRFTPTAVKIKRNAQQKGRLKTTGMSSGHQLVTFRTMIVLVLLLFLGHGLYFSWSFKPLAVVHL